MGTTLTFKCPKCKALMNMEGERPIYKDDIALAKLEWYECPKCKIMCIAETMCEYRDLKTNKEINVSGVVYHDDL